MSEENSTDELHDPFEDEPLPTVVTVTQAFIARLPSQRVIDLILRLEPGATMQSLMTDQPSRVTAFRALSKDYPTRDATSLWMHAYDVEVAVADVDPTSNGSTPALPPSVPTTTSVLPPPRN